MNRKTTDGSNHVQPVSGALLNYKKGKPLPLGVSKQGNTVQFAVSVPGTNEVKLRLYKKGQEKWEHEIIMDESFRFGSVFSVRIENLETEWYEYIYEVMGEELLDPFAVKINGRSQFGKVPARAVRAGIYFDSFDWEDDKVLDIPYEDLILYQLHVRGFTKHYSSKVLNRGTFKGMEEKIPYLLELGVNGVLLLPCYEFPEMIGDEMDLMAKHHLNRYHIEETTEIKYHMNYWGYGKGCNYFAPKSSYASDPDHPGREYKNLIKKMHQNGIEVIMDMCFEEGTNQCLIVDCLRYWAVEYHIDGFKVNDNVVPAYVVAADPVLMHLKLFSTSWDTGLLYGKKKPFYKNLAEFNDGFMVDARRFLKGDEGFVDKFIERTRKNPKQHAVINYMTKMNGFTLMDLVSYDQKHNEPNGEENRDGTDFNFSWNCGVEGRTRRRAIMLLRKRQIKNAVSMLLLSQGTPMILSGDEFGNSAMGNNNPYCQDNEISWLNWNFLQSNRDLFDYFKSMIRLRKEHPILHMPEELTVMDHLSCGYPDISFHGTKAWYPDFATYSRTLGILLCGKYAELLNKKTDHFFYIIYNMHWESHTFGLPKLPDKMEWKIALHSMEPNMEQLTQKQKEYTLQPRSFIIFISGPITEKEREASE